MPSASAARVRGRRLTLLGHRLQDRVDVVEIRCVLVESDDVGAAAECFEGVPAGSAADVQDTSAQWWQVPEQQALVVGVVVPVENAPSVGHAGVTPAR